LQHGDHPGIFAPCPEFNIIQSYIEPKGGNTRVNTYETLFIVNPELEEGEIEKTIDFVQEVITAGGGTILKIDKWGRRQLAYEIQKKREGYYVILYFQAPPTLITELNRRYKLTDTIMRYLILQLRKDQVGEIVRSTKSVESTEKPAQEEMVGVEGAEDEEKLVVETEGE
jgi:small subunit ribosomal protein S6